MQGFGRIPPATPGFGMDAFNRTLLAAMILRPGTDRHMHGAGASIAVAVSFGPQGILNPPDRPDLARVPVAKVAALR